MSFLNKQVLLSVRFQIQVKEKQKIQFTKANMIRRNKCEAMHTLL